MLRWEDLSIGFLYQVKDFAGIPTGPDEWDILGAPQRSVTVLTSYVSCLLAQREGISVEAAAMQVMALHPIELMACYRGGGED